MPDATPPRPLTAEDVEQRLLADVAEARARLAEITAERDRLRTDLADAEKADDDLVSEILRNMREEDGDDIAPGALCVRYVRSLEAGREKLLAANQRWAETLADVQQRHAEVKRERDAHKLRAGHYEGLWRAEHGLPPDGSDDLARDRDLAASVRAVIARYKADDVNALTAFADIMNAAGDSAPAPVERDPVAVTLEAANEELGEALTRARAERDDLARRIAEVAPMLDELKRLGGQLEGERAALEAGLRELTGTHETLLEEILRNADEDINGGDEAAEYLAEAYVRFLEGSLKSASDERDKLSGACGLLARTLSMYVRSLYATWIDAAQHRNLTAVIEVLAESLDGFDGPEWNGAETGAQWLERTRGVDVVSEALSENEDDGTETASVLADPETMAAIAEGERDLHGEARDDA